MKAKHATLALGVVLIGLVAFVALYEQKLPSSSELGTRSRHWLKTFVRERTTSIEITARSKTLRLTRPADDVSALAEATWTLTAPITATADNEAVQSLLGALEWADARRTFEAADAVTLAASGLDHPRLRATIVSAGARIQIVFGAEDPRGQGVYAMIVGEPDAYVIGKDVFEALDYDADHFRAKELWGTFSVHRASNVVIETSARTTLRRDGNRWLASVNGASILANRTRVEATLTALDNARVTRFLDRATNWGAASGAPAGPILTIQITLGFGTAPDAGIPTQVSLAVGESCPEHADEVAVTVMPSGAVACLSRASIDALLAADANTFLEARVVPMDEELIESVRVIAGETVTANANVSEAHIRVMHAITGRERVALDGMHEIGRIEIKASAQPLSRITLLRDSARIAFRRDDEAMGWLLSPEDLSALQVPPPQVPAQ